MGILIALLGRLGIPQGLARVLGVVVPIALAGALVAFLWARGDHYKHQRDNLRDWQTTVTAATRAASGRPKLATGEVAKQIAFLGQAVDSLELGIATRNVQIAADAAKYQASAKQWQADNASNARKAVTSDATIQHWRELAKKPGDGRCVADQATLDGLAEY